MVDLGLQNYKDRVRYVESGFSLENYTTRVRLIRVRVRLVEAMIGLENYTAQVRLRESELGNLMASSLLELDVIEARQSRIGF